MRGAGPGRAHRRPDAGAAWPAAQGQNPRAGRSSRDRTGFPGGSAASPSPSRPRASQTRGAEGGPAVSGAGTRSALPGRGQPPSRPSCKQPRRRVNKERLITPNECTLCSVRAHPLKPSHTVLFASTQKPLRAGHAHGPRTRSRGLHVVVTALLLLLVLVFVQVSGAQGGRCLEEGPLSQRRPQGAQLLLHGAQLRLIPARRAAVRARGAAGDGAGS